VEIATYPQGRVPGQMVRDIASVLLDRDTLPEAITLVLRPHPRSPLRIASEHALQSAHGLTSLKVSWRVVELWNVPAEHLLASGDVGMIPWVPLSRIDGPAEPVLRRCRERIDALAQPGEKQNLLAVTQVLAGLRYNDPGVAELFGGRQTMIESPVIQELVEEVEQKAMQKGKHDDILLFLESRFGLVPQEVGDAVRRVSEEARLRSLIQLAARCADIEAFRGGLPAAAGDKP
jgi:predicted transposase YdaD